MLRCLGKNIFLLQSVPLFAGLFQELECFVYGMGPILLKCTRVSRCGSTNEVNDLFLISGLQP